MSALPPKADIGGGERDLRFVPEAAPQQNFLYDWQISWLFALENPAGLDGDWQAAEWRS
jgi:hypothetical protein